jgi:O-antigen ligase
MTDRIEKVFPYLLLAPAVLPLVYVSGLVYPYIAIKIFLLWGLGIVASAIFVFLALSGTPFYYQRLRSAFSLIPLTLLVVEYVTSYFGVDFYRSFWGLFARGDGLLTSTIITIFFYLILISAPTPSGVGSPTSDVGADRKLLERLVKVVAVVAGIVAAIAVLQWVTTMFGGKAWFLPPVTGRIGSTFGNAAFLAGYLGMSLFVIFLVLRDSIGVWRRVYQISAILAILAIIFAATRGTIFALIGAGVVGLIFVAIKGIGGWKRFARYSLVVVVMLIGLFFVFRTQLAENSFEPVRRIAQISFSDGTKGTVSSRFFVWRHITEEALDRPILGYGAEHIAQIFDKIYDPSSIIEQWFDRSHNAFLDYFVQYGIGGLLLYLSLIGAFAVLALRMYRNNPFETLNPGLLFLLLIITYAVQNFFVFDTPHSLWLLYALFASLMVLSDDSSAAPLLLKRIPPFASSIVSAIILLAIIPTVLLPLYANIMLTKGYLLHLVDVNKANAYFEQGLSLGTYADLEYGYQAYDMYTAHQVVQLKDDDLVSGYKYALSLLTANFKKYPYDARTATYLAHVIDTAPEGVPIDEGFDREVLSRAIELSPLRAQAWYMTVNIYLRQADALPETSPEREKFYREAINVLEEYAQLEPSLPVSPFILSTIYYKLGDRAEAKKWADAGLKAYAERDVAAAKPAVKYYLATGDWQNAVRFLSDIVEADSSDIDALFDLAKVMYLAGDRAASIRIVENIRETNPDILLTDANFMKAITDYEQTQK